MTVKYEIILADPPWSYKDKCHAGKRGAGYKYQTLSDREIVGLNVGSLAADNCALFLWATPPRLPLAMEAMAAWGFEYKTIAFTWIKTSKNGNPMWGMGNWTRANAEHVLLGVRGKPKRVSGGVHSVIMSPRGAHSAKPAVVRDRIVELLGDLPKIELFAREQAAGWRATGLDCDGENVRDFIKKVPG